MIYILSILDFCSTEYTLAGEYLLSFSQPWQALVGLSDFIIKLGHSLPKEEYERYGKDVWIHKDTVIYPTAFVKGPCIIGQGTQVRHGAFIRGSALIGRGCTVGNSTEIKNSILSDGAQVPHFNYVGDSILGYKAHLGAGAIISNVRSDKKEVGIISGTGRLSTGMKKFGAIVGDKVEIGCGSVLCPGSLIGRGSVIYPLVRVRGSVEENMIVKGENIIVRKV